MDKSTTPPENVRVISMCPEDNEARPDGIVGDVPTVSHTVVEMEEPEADDKFAMGENLYVRRQSKSPARVGQAPASSRSHSKSSTRYRSSTSPRGGPDAAASTSTFPDDPELFEGEIDDKMVNRRWIDLLRDIATRRDANGLALLLAKMELNFERGINPKYALNQAYLSVKEQQYSEWLANMWLDRLEAMLRRNVYEDYVKFVKQIAELLKDRMAPEKVLKVLNRRYLKETKNERPPSTRPSSGVESCDAASAEEIAQKSEPEEEDSSKKKVKSGVDWKGLFMRTTPKKEKLKSPSKLKSPVKSLPKTGQDSQRVEVFPAPEPSAPMSMPVLMFEPLEPPENASPLVAERRVFMPRNRRTVVKFAYEGMISPRKIFP